MEENVSMKPCLNCKRDIPSGNFITHSIHCARNIKICNVCKEPVPLTDLQEHNDKLHVLLPCKKCKEMVRGTDMEDHIRDSCDYTIQTCRFCALELMRREMRAHERYCGTRTEKCKDCGEYVMIRYRQLHVDSNHAFICLEEDTPGIDYRRQCNHERAPRGRFGEQPPPPMFLRNRDEAGQRAPTVDDALRRRVMSNLPLFYPRVVGVTRPEDIRQLGETMTQAGPMPLHPPYTGLLMPVPGAQLPPDYDMNSLRALTFTRQPPLLPREPLPTVIAPAGEMTLGEDAASFRESIRLARSAARKRQAPQPPGTRTQSARDISNQNRYEEPSRDQEPRRNQRVNRRDQQETRRDQPETRREQHESRREQHESRREQHESRREQPEREQPETRRDQQEAGLDQQNTQNTAAGQPPVPDSAAEAERQRMIEILRRKEKEANRKKLLLERLTAAAKEAAEGFGSGRSTCSVATTLAQAPTITPAEREHVRALATAIYNANNANVQIASGDSQTNRFSRGIWLENATQGGRPGSYMISDIDRAIMEAQVLGEANEINSLSEVNNCVNAVDPWARIVEATSGVNMGARASNTANGAQAMGATDGPIQGSQAVGAANESNAGAQTVTASKEPNTVPQAKPANGANARAQTKIAINEANARAQAMGAANGPNAQAKVATDRANDGVPTSDAIDGSNTQALGTANKTNAAPPTANTTNGVGAPTTPANGANVRAQAVAATNGANRGAKTVVPANGDNVAAKAGQASGSNNAETHGAGPANVANSATNGANTAQTGGPANEGAQAVGPTSAANERPQAAGPANADDRPRTFVFVNGGLTGTRTNGTTAHSYALAGEVTLVPANRAHAEDSANGSSNAGSSASASAAPQPSADQRQRESLRDLEPMSPEEFTIRFRQLQVRRDPRELVGDRFAVIRTSLRDLRRGLNEVMAPYNNNNSAPNNNASADTNARDDCDSSNEDDDGDSPNEDDDGQLEEARAPTPVSVDRAVVEELMLPCEICSRMVSAPRLHAHERECRMNFDDAQSADGDVEYVPMIPCEFCSLTLPYFSINQHQERCRRDSYLLDLD